MRPKNSHPNCVKHIFRCWMFHSKPAISCVRSVFANLVLGEVWFQTFFELLLPTRPAQETWFQAALAIRRSFFRDFFQSQFLITSCHTKISVDCHMFRNPSQIYEKRISSSWLGVFFPKAWHQSNWTHPWGWPLVLPFVAAKGVEGFQRFRTHWKKILLIAVLAGLLGQTVAREVLPLNHHLLVFFPNLLAR